MAKSNFKNRTIFTGDNLPILRGFPDDFVDLIYLDPPFNSKHNYAASTGSKAAGAEFKDTWTLKDVDMAWWGEIADTNPSMYKTINIARAGGRSTMSYLIYMAIRILEMHRILKETGSLYLHCDSTMSHYLKTTLDAIFGHKNHRNEIFWKRHTSFHGGSQHKPKQWGRLTDTILYYTKTKHADLRPFPTLSEDKFNSVISNDKSQRHKHESDYVDSPLGNLWTDIKPVTAVDKYPTQKPLALLERIIGASSKKGELVLDPFCGCATTCYAAERLGRKWIGIDISPKAADLLKNRLKLEAGLDDIIHRTDIPKQKGQRSPNIKDKLYGMQKGCCNICKYWFEYHYLEVEKITSKSQRILDVEIKNLQLLCRYCKTLSKK